MKGIRAKKIFEEVPVVRDILISGELWIDDHFVRAVAEMVMEEIIQRYIRHQDRRDKGPQLKVFLSLCPEGCCEDRYLFISEFSEESISTQEYLPDLQF